MSDLERNAVLHLERQPQILDIREQFPLDREVTREIARAMGVRHPTDPVSRVEIVMTTDLLVTFIGCGGIPLTRPLSIKESSDLLKRRTREKQEIERRYWERMGFRWVPLLDSALRGRDYFNALLWAREWFHLPGSDERTLMVWKARCQRLLAELAADRCRTLGELVRRVEPDGEFGAGEVLSTLRHLVARQVVDYEFEAGTPTLSTPLTRFAVRAGGLRRAA